LKRLINTSEHVDKEHFVLFLTGGVMDPKGTVDANSVRLQLVCRLGDTLSLLCGSLQEKRETYSHTFSAGFGSGISHFMAVLHVMLQKSL
jgi:hypothetical protein